METIPCPGCRTALEPSATVCPVCLRPRGKLEITRAYVTLRQAKKERQRRPFVIAGYLLAAGAAGWLAYRYHAPIVATSVSARARAERFVDESLASADPVVNRAAAPTVLAPPASAASRPAPAPARVPQAKAEQRPARVEDLPLPAFDSGTQWVFYGRVYDLITLLPVSDVQLSFTTAGGASDGIAGGSRSDGDGRFAAVLRRLTEGSYEIRASRADYASTALYESDIPYARLPLAERRELARSAQDGDMTLPPLTDIAGDGSVRRDVFLAPSR